MKRIIIIILLGGIEFCFSQKIIDYQHKLIKKEIIKTFNTENYILSELKHNNSNLLPGNFFNITSNESLLGYCYIGRVNSCRAGGCSAPDEEDGANTFEYFDYLVTFNLNCEVASVKVFNYQATHGQEICSKNWLKQFIGYNGYKPLEVGKDIDAISGATISVYSIVVDIERVTEKLMFEIQ